MLLQVLNTLMKLKKKNNVTFLRRDAKKGKPRPEGAGKPSQQIEVTDIKNNITTSYDSIHEAARALNISNHQAITNYFRQNQKKPYKGRYTFKKI